MNICKLLAASVTFTLKIGRCRPKWAKILLLLCLISYLVTIYRVPDRWNACV